MSGFIHEFQTNPFSYDGKHCVMESKDIGICADIASLLTPPDTVSALRCFQGCPYTNTGFQLDVWFCGEKIRCEGWQWLPNAILRWGSIDGLRVECLTVMIPGTRSAVQRYEVKNTSETKRLVPLQVAYRGRTRFHEVWKFPTPKEEKSSREDYFARDGLLGAQHEGCGFCLASSLKLRPFERAYMGEEELSLEAGEKKSFYLSAHMGTQARCLKEARELRSDYEKALEDALAYLQKETQRIHRQLPRLRSDCKELDQLYRRSLVNYILCRWENPDLCSMPYYSTGGINGACMCSYLWDYCGGLMLHPVYDPQGNKVQLLAYLKNDLTQSYALNPVTAGPVGPWYQINQEKIILMVYYHVLFTGDRDFLKETVGDKTVLEWMRFYAYVCDDRSENNALWDYGEGGNDHLEIHNWGNGPYNGVMPDLNARRYLNYMRVYELTKVAGCPDEQLPRRAAGLKEALKQLWNPRVGWYDFIDAQGKRDLRYTVQMFKFLNSPVLDEEQREALVLHLNEREFLSPFGLHSMSKLDPQYDQDDIDNGGGGICTHFTMQICAQLYEMGYDALATDILRRVYWWGSRLVYMGDSCAANRIQNREDTPLQGDISSVSCAQMIFFFIFGIRADFDGSIRICPVKHRPAENMQVENARLCQKTFSVAITGEEFCVTCEGKSYVAKVGETVTLK